MSEQGWHEKAVYRVMADDEPREAILVTSVPEDKALLKDPKAIAVGAGIVVNFLQKELSPQMLEVVLVMLYSKGQAFFDSTVIRLQETLKAQREVIRALVPPPEVTTLVEREIEWLADREEKRPLVEWLDIVQGGGGEVYDSEEGEEDTRAGEGGETDPLPHRGKEGVGAGATKREEGSGDGAP